MNKKGNVLAIVIMFFLFAMISFVTGLQNPMGVIVKAQFGASNAMSQLGNLANFIAYAFMGLPAGFILKKYGYKITSLAAVTVGFVGVGVSFLSGVSESFAIYLTGAFISGFSMCMLNTVVNPMLNTLGGGGNKGNQLIQFGGSLNSLAATIVPVFVGYLIGNAAQAKITDANPALFIAMGIFALAFIIILFSQIPEPELEAAAVAKDKKTEGTMASIKGALAHRNLVFGVIAIFVYVGVEVGIPNIANLYMTSGEIGLAASVAGTVVGIYWLLMLCGRFLGGLIGGKVSSRAMMITVSSVAAVLLLLGMFLPSTMVTFPTITQELTFSTTQIPLGVVFFMLCGLCTSVMWGSIFNLAVEGLGKYTSIASGLFMVMVCGGGVLPLIQGWVADAFGFLQSYWVLVIGVFYMLIFALFLSKPSKTE
ncbi:MAG: MFS transporter [Bacteroidales bacterium]|nr:MFS transporter [Bacteroidales bacterium]